MEPTRPSSRNAVGTLVLIFGLMLYAFGAAAIGDLMNDWHVLIQFIYYAIAGIAWIFPVRRLFIWMAQSKNQSNGGQIE